MALGAQAYREGARPQYTVHSNTVLSFRCSHLSDVVNTVEGERPHTFTVNVHLLVAVRVLDIHRTVGVGKDDAARVELGPSLIPRLDLLPDAVVLYGGSFATVHAVFAIDAACSAACSAAAAATICLAVFDPLHGRPEVFPGVEEERYDPLVVRRRVLAADKTRAGEQRAPLLVRVDPDSVRGFRKEAELMDLERGGLVVDGGRSRGGRGCGGRRGCRRSRAGSTLSGSRADGGGGSNAPQRAARGGRCILEIHLSRSPRLVTRGWMGALVPVGGHGLLR